MTKSGPCSLVECFATITDPRIDRRKRHNLHDVLIISICSLLCGAETFVDMNDFGICKEEWFETFLELPNGIPSHDTFRRVFSLINPTEFQEAFSEWTQSFRKAIPEEVIAMDGKALRRSTKGGKCLTHMVSAWATENSLVLGQVKVQEKSNEITAVPELLRRLELKGCIVTLDAMGCQKNIAKEIIEAEADYCLSLKGNHSTLEVYVETFFADARKNSFQDIEHSFLEMQEKGHGREETRRYWICEEVSWLPGYEQWKNLCSIGMVESTRKLKGKEAMEQRLYLCSFGANAERFAKAVRGHWRIENSLHWVLDMSFNEDQCRVRSDYAAENLATLRHMALNLLKQDTTKKRGIKGKQKNAGWDHRYLLSLLKI